MNENKARSRLDQRRAPIYEALERFRQMRVVPFDVPGHKRGRGNPELTAFLHLPMRQFRSGTRNIMSIAIHCWHFSCKWESVLRSLISVAMPNRNMK